MANIVSYKYPDAVEINSIITLSLSSADVECVDEAMAALCDLLHSSKSNVDVNRKHAVFGGAIHAILQAMGRNEHSVSIQTNGLIALANISLCILQDFKPNILADGGLEYCVSVMVKNPCNSFLQAYGCCLIGNLWLPPELRARIVDGGGLVVVMTALTQNQQDARVQQEGVWALSVLLHYSTTWAIVAADCGCIELVISAMNNHPDHSEIQMYGCDFLSHLSFGHWSNRNTIIEARGLVSVVEAMRIHSGNSQVKLAAQRALLSISA